MTQWIIRRLGYSLTTLLAISIVVFLLVRLTGDPVVLFLPQDASAEEVARVRRLLGFEDPLTKQYARFLTSAVRGDLGLSIRHQEPALQVVLKRFPATLELATAAMLLTLAVSLPAGIGAALMRNSWFDRLVMSVIVLGQSLPSYWFGIMLILVVSVQWSLLPPLGRGTLAHLVMPSVTLALFFIARIARLTRSGMLNVLRNDYVRTARAKGLSSTMVVLKHALRNASLPIVTIVAIEFGTLLGGTVITETVFAWPGLGRLAVDAIFSRDYPVVQTVVLLISVIFVSLNFLVDLFYRVIDPRIELV
jgi:ABC-type dipeptide/oligopeptide/nickel transport system permease component